MPSDESTVEITHDTARDESVCGVFCDAEPEVSFEAFGYTFHWCRDCYEEPCNRCQSQIAEGEGENRAKGWCQSCREEIRLICGDDERGIQKDDGEEQAKLLTDGGRETAETHHVEGVGMDTVVRCEDTGNAYGPGTLDPSTPGYCPYCGDRVGDDQHRIAESFDEVFCDNTGMSTWRYCPGCGESGVEINA